MDAALHRLDRAHAPLEIIIIVLQSLSLEERFSCALVCKAWAEAATAATRSIIIRHREQDLSCLQAWLQKHGGQLEVLQLHLCLWSALTALPCSQLQDLLLHGSSMLSISSSVWNGIAADTKLTSVSLRSVWTGSQQADAVSAPTTLPDLKQLTWCSISCSRQDRYGHLSDSLLLQKLTHLTALELKSVTAAALQHLGSLTKLQRLSIDDACDWAEAGCPGLQELKALTWLFLDLFWADIPAGISLLTALQELTVAQATLTDVSWLQALTGLTHLWLLQVTAESFEPSAAQQLPGLRHLHLSCDVGSVAMSFLRECTQLQVLSIQNVSIMGPGSLLASTMLQHMELERCSFVTAGWVADPGSWQQVFSVPGGLPRLTSLDLSIVSPELQQADFEDVVSCCGSLQVLTLDTLQDSFCSALMHLSGLTSLTLNNPDDQQCSSLPQLTGLRALGLGDASEVSVAGLRQLAALQQLTSLGIGYNFDLAKSRPELKELMSDRLPRSNHAIVSKVSSETSIDHSLSVLL